MELTKKNKLKEVWSCDFETTTDPNDCRVWAWGASNIYDTSVKFYGNTIESFLDWCSIKSRKLYFHNLSFDGEFIVFHLLNTGWEFGVRKEGAFKTIISNMGLWYEISIYHQIHGRHVVKTTIWDSFKLIPFSVQQIAHDFNLDIRKLKLDYDAYREPGHELTEHEKDYLFNDVDIVALALRECFDNGFDKITATTAAFKSFKSFLPCDFKKIFPVIPVEDDKELRKSYAGGFVWANPIFKNTVIEEGIVFDVNSLYPSRMYVELLPFDFPIYFTGKYIQDELYPLWIGSVTFAFDIKPGHIPCITLGSYNARFGTKRYLSSSDGDIVTLVLTSVDWELIQEQYDVYDVNFNGGYKFRACTGLANEFIDSCMERKKNNKGAKRFIAKREMNGCYGKFATNPNITPKLPYIKDDGSLGLKDPTYTTYMNGEICEVIDEEYKDPVYLPYASFVTAYARKYTIQTAQKVGLDRICYIDTDSIHLKGTDTPEAIKDIIDDKELGYWGLESIYKRAYFVGAKAYIEEIQIEKEVYETHQKEYFEEFDKLDNLYYIRDGIYYFLNVKCAGLTEKAKQNVTFENFRVGKVYKDCLKKAHVKGGIVLYDRTFKIKER